MFWIMGGMSLFVMILQGFWKLKVSSWFAIQLQSIRHTDKYPWYPLVNMQDDSQRAMFGSGNSSTPSEMNRWAGDFCDPKHRWFQKSSPKMYIVYLCHILIHIVSHAIYISQMLHGAGISTYIYPKHGSHVGKYSTHGASGYVQFWRVILFCVGARVSDMYELVGQRHNSWPNVFSLLSPKPVWIIQNCMALYGSVGLHMSWWYALWLVRLNCRCWYIETYEPLLVDQLDYKWLCSMFICSPHQLSLLTLKN